MKTKRFPFLPLSLAATVALAAGCATFEETLAAADKGDASAMYSVGMSYASGNGVEQNLDKAEDYLARARLLGDKKAQRALILLYIGNGMIDHWDEVLEKIGRIAESSMWHRGLDAEMLEKAPAFSMALVRNGELSKRQEFDRTVLDIAEELYEANRPFGQRGFSQANLPEIDEYETMMCAVDCEESRIVQLKKEAEREAKAERERKEAEERARAEAEREAAEKKAREQAEAAEKKAREEAEALWLARKVDPAWKFPLRASFPDSVTVYKEIQTGCSLEWAEEYVRHEGFARTNRVDSFPDMACGVAEATERPLPEEFDRQDETETSMFVRNPENLTFSDGGRVVTLTFGSPSPDGVERVLVSGEIQFPDGGATADALAEKYANAVPGGRKTQTEATYRTGGQTILPFIRLPVSTMKKALTAFASEKAAVKIVEIRSVSLFWDSPSSQKINVSETGKVSLGDPDLELRILAAPELSGEEVGKALAMWHDVNKHCGKPAISIVDRALFKAMEDAKTKESALAEENRRAAERAAEEEQRERMKKSLDSF